jgi:hypothetical protein
MRTHLLSYDDKDQALNDSGIDAGFYSYDSDGKKSWNNKNVKEDVNVYQDGRRLPGFWVMVQTEGDMTTLDMNRHRRASWDDEGKLISSNDLDYEHIYVDQSFDKAKSPFKGKQPTADQQPKKTPLQTVDMLGNEKKTLVDAHKNFPTANNTPILESDLKNNPVAGSEQNRAAPATSSQSKPDTNPDGKLPSQNFQVPNRK